MRSLSIAAVLVADAAHADVSIGAQVGAGAQNATAYSALELRLDAAWQHGHVGIGARGIWDGDQFRERDWDTPWAAVSIVRDAAVTGRVGDVTLAAAAGALAPATVGRIVDGYRVALDDRWRTGVRAAVHSRALEVSAEIDDVLDPRLVAGGASWIVTDGWGAVAGVAVDPGIATAVELGGFHRFATEGARLDLGASLVVEPAPTGVVFAAGELERDGLRLRVRGDARYGTAGLFGPLYRVEGPDTATGAGAGIGAGIASERGWFDVSARRRPGLGGLIVASTGAPMSRWLQAAAWVAAGDHVAGAAELRIVWSNSLFTALHAARMLRVDAMTVEPVTSITAWFGAASL